MCHNACRRTTGIASAVRRPPEVLCSSPPGIPPVVRTRCLTGLPGRSQGETASPRCDRSFPRAGRVRAVQEPYHGLALSQPVVSLTLPISRLRYFAPSASPLLSKNSTRTKPGKQAATEIRVLICHPPLTKTSETSSERYALSNIIGRAALPSIGKCATINCAGMFMNAHDA